MDLVCRLVVIVYNNYISIRDMYFILILIFDDLCLKNFFKDLVNI